MNILWNNRRRDLEDRATTKDVIRVSQTAVDNPYMSEKHKAHFQKWLDKTYTT